VREEQCERAGGRGSGDERGGCWGSVGGGGESGGEREPATNLLGRGAERVEGSFGAEGSGSVLWGYEGLSAAAGVVQIRLCQRLATLRTAWSHRTLHAICMRRTFSQRPSASREHMLVPCEFQGAALDRDV